MTNSSSQTSFWDFLIHNNPNFYTQCKWPDPYSIFLSITEAFQIENMSGANGSNLKEMKISEMFLIWRLQKQLFLGGPVASTWCHGDS
jgi:hypothetical protein